MAVPEQTPYIEHIANGVTTSFALEFECKDKEHLIVLVDYVEPNVGTWSLANGSVVFATAPSNGKIISIQRNTPFRRDTNFQSYDNSLRPATINKDFDWIWYKLQELGVADWILGNRIDALKNYVDDRDDELRAYLMEEIRKQGVALDQLEDYYNYLMERLAQIAVDKGWDSSFVVHKGQTQFEINEDFFNKKWEKVSVKDFGAKGDDDQTLYDTDYYSDNISQPTRILKQTADGLSINRAIKWLRNRGGGSLYIPPCESGKSYRVYGYLERIDFPCVIYGAGAQSLLKNCDNSPTNINGYGIFHISPAVVSEVSFLNFKVDGNAQNRIKPTSEFRLYNFHICGKSQTRMYGVTSVNAAIDCLCTRYTRPYEMASEGDILWAKFVNCHFEDSYRNTLSLVAGNNIDFVNCNVWGGGFIQGGTNPRYSLDIEPTSGLIDNHARNIKFTNCNFARAINAVVGGTWGEAIFENCTIDASYKHPNITQIGYPWAFTLSSLGDWKLNNCKIVGNATEKSTICTHYNAYDLISDFAENGWLKIHNTEFEYCGFNGNGRRLEVRNVIMKNSLRPFALRKGTEIPSVDVSIHKLKLINIFENTTGSGGNSSFSIGNFSTGQYDIDGIDILVDLPLLQKKFIPSDFGRSGYCGFIGGTGLNASAAAGHRVSVKNVYCEGFYKRLKDFLNASSGTYRDWELPNLAPANTDLVASSVAAALLSGTVANNAVTNLNVSGTATQNNPIASRTMGGRTVATYKDCSMWGDYS